MCEINSSFMCIGVSINKHFICNNHDNKYSCCKGNKKKRQFYLCKMIRTVKIKF